jgi:uncharacterized membrane protein
MEPGLTQLALAMVAAMQTIYYYHILPARIASHFGARGVPDGWSSSSSFFVTYWIVIALVFAVSLIVPALIGILPRRLINLPNKDYWLSDEMYSYTMTYFRTQFRWFGAILLLFIVIVFQMVFHANLSQNPDLGMWFIPALIGFLVAVLVWGIRFNRKFSRAD